MKQNQMTKEEKEQENKLLKFNKTLENCTNQRLLNQSSRFMRGVKEYQRKPLLLTPTTAPYTSFPNRLPSYPCFLTWPTSSQQVAIVGWILFTRQGKFAKIRPSNISSVQIFRFVYNDVSPFFYFFVIFMVFFFRFFFFTNQYNPHPNPLLISFHHLLQIALENYCDHFQLRKVHVYNAGFRFFPGELICM